jgi:hypothetical protein
MPDVAEPEAARPIEVERGRRPWQFPLWALMLFTAGVAVSLALWGEFPPLAIVGIFATAAIPALALPRKPPGPRDAAIFLGVASVAMALMIYAAHLAYYTIGELVDVAYGIAILVPGVSFVIMGLFAKTRRLGYVWLLTLAALLVPYQLVLEARWYRLDAEARAIISYLNACQAKHGAYPSDLSGYTFRHPELAQEFWYRTGTTSPIIPSPAFQLGYQIGANSTSHIYTPECGWFFYPD